MDDKLVEEMLRDHSRNPRHYGELKSPDVEAEVTNPQCVGPTHPDGDRVSLQVTLSDDGNTVKNVRFTGSGLTLIQTGGALWSVQMVGTDVYEDLGWKNE